jgi:uncharacterized protein (DUF58 family)
MRLLGALRAMLKPPRTLRVTPLGRVYLVLTVGIGLAALNTGNNLLYLVLGVLLALIVLSGVLSEQAIWDLEVRRLLPEGAFAGEPFALRYELRRGRGVAFGLQLTELAPGLAAQAFAPLVTDREPAIIRADATPSRRGPLRLKRLRIATAYPFGIFEKARELELEAVLVIYPRRGFACQTADPHHGHTLGDTGSPRHRDGTGDLLGLRELRPLEDARRVHWKKSAAAGKVLTVEREREERRQLTLTIGEGPDLDVLDRQCEEVAAQAQHWLKLGYEVGLAAGASRLRPASGPGQERRLLSALAWVGFARGHGG